MPAKRIRPHGVFRVWSPDTVAECLDGVPDDIYRKIWNEIVPLYADKQRSEVPDDFDEVCLARYWKHFTAEEQDCLNSLAKADDDAREKFLSEARGY